MTILNININDFGGINHHMEEFKNKYGKDAILVDGMLGNKYRISKKSFDEWLDQKSETI